MHILIISYLGANWGHRDKSGRGEAKRLLREKVPRERIRVQVFVICRQFYD